MTERTPGDAGSGAEPGRWWQRRPASTPTPDAPEHVAPGQPVPVTTSVPTAPTPDAWGAAAPTGDPWRGPQAPQGPQRPVAAPYDATETPWWTPRPGGATDDTGTEVLHGGPSGRPPSRADRRGPSTAVLLAVGLAIALVAGALGGALGLVAADRSTDTPQQQGTSFDGSSLGAAAEGPTDRAPESIAGVAGAVLPSVVSISVEGQGQQGTGSGFILTAEGLIVTNNHVVAPGADGGDIQVSFADGRRVPARIVGRDAGYDLAVLQVDAQNLPPLALGSSESIQVGDPVIAIGSPLGLSGTVTTGIISAKDRPVTAGGQGGGDASYISALQTDAAINPGNSGGPLVNLAGEVVGVNSAIASVGAEGLGGGPTGSIGLGFAIPIDQARRTVEQLIQTGAAVRPVIGASLDGRFPGPGALISRETSPDGTPPLIPDGPAEAAGLRAGDVILEIDGEQVLGNEELIVAIRARVPGDEVVLTVQRGREELEVPVVLGASGE